MSEKDGVVNNENEKNISVPQTENEKIIVASQAENDYEKEIARLREEYVGNILDDRYEILEVVGKGGMACVLKARDMTMNRIVAIKILDSALNEDPISVERFKNESQAIAMMSHKNIVTVYDVVFHDDMKYIIMEFLNGITFEKYLSKKEKLQWKEACYFMYKILGALEHSHSRGIIHSDVKPQNMMIDKDGEIILTDFGIATLPSDISGNEELLKEALGTAYYMSPEQAGGKLVCEQSDIYSVGVILYEAVSGRLPFSDEDPYIVMEKHITETPVSPASYADDIPDGLIQIITKALRKNADERYLSAREMADAIEEITKNPSKTFDGIEIPDIIIVDDTRIKERQKKEKIEKRKKKREAKKEAKLTSPVSRSFFPIITGVALAFIIVCEAVIGYSLWEVVKHINLASTLETIFYSDSDVQITVPNLVGREWKDVLQQIDDGTLADNKGNKIIIDPAGITAEFNSEYGYGVIISQEPAGNMQIKDNKITSLVLSLGSERVFMPDVLYMSKREAETVIRDAVGDEYSVEFIKMKHEYAHFEQVIKTEPEAGQLVTNLESGNDIKIYYCESENPTEMRMPDLVGKSFEEAKREIENYHLILGNIETKESLNIGSTVLEQSIKPYESVMPYATIIDLVVSKQVEFAPMLDVKGKKADEAKKLLKGYGLLNVKVEYVYTSKDDGIVIDQNVSAGENVSADTSIIIYVNVHANTSVVPDLSGKTLEEAQALLAAENITDIEITTEKSFKPEGTVIYQSVPAGTEVLKGNKIEIIISSESETIAMKDFYGKTPEEAEKWFKRVGISYIIGDQVDSNEKTGVIISQSIPAYFSVSRGETVRIYVNRYVPSETESSEELAQ